MSALRKGQLYRRNGDGFVFRVEATERHDGRQGANLQCLDATLIFGRYTEEQVARDFTRVTSKDLNVEPSPAPTDPVMHVKRSIVQAVFDVAIASAGFQSDFLDNEDVDSLRALAVELGVDPIEATPRSHKCRYLNEHSFGRWQDMTIIKPGLNADHDVRRVFGKSRWCLRCSKREDKET